METELILCDTNVFIHLLNNDTETVTRLERFGFSNLLMSSITAMELLLGMGNKSELQKMQKIINQYHVVDFNAKVSLLSRKLIEQFSLSHKLGIPDSIIGATAIAYDLPFFTYNVKDFRYMPNIRLV